MVANSKTKTHGQATLTRYEDHGLLIGLTIGLVVGVIISGPNFHDWSPVTSFLVIAACTIGGAVIGYFAGAIGASSTAGSNIDLGSGHEFGGHSGGDSGSSGSGDAGVSGGG